MKFFLAVLLLAFAAYVSADCDELEAVKVKRQWADAFGTAHDRLDFGKKLWQSIIKDHPEIRGVFGRVHGDDIYSVDFSAHSQRVLSGVDMSISMLESGTTLAAQLAHLKGQHAERNLKPEYFDWFRNHLLELLGDVLGVKFAYSAWNDCLGEITESIK